MKCSARYDFHLARIKSNAKLLAIPTADVDHKAWLERLKHYAEWGFNVLNVAAFFVPGLGEVMLAVTAVQLSYEVYQGVQSWRHGDAEEAWTHLKSVMANVAFMAALGAVAGKAPPIVPSRFVNGMTKVALPFGKLRLWHPDLATYKSSVSLEGLTPNALGQFEVGARLTSILTATSMKRPSTQPSTSGQSSTRPTRMPTSRCCSTTVTAPGATPWNVRWNGVAPRCCGEQGRTWSVFPMRNWSRSPMPVGSVTMSCERYTSITTHRRRCCRRWSGCLKWISKQTR